MDEPEPTFSNGLIIRIVHNDDAPLAGIIMHEMTNNDVKRTVSPCNVAFFIYGTPLSW
jgi:hypothetical protein